MSQAATWGMPSGPPAKPAVVGQRINDSLAALLSSHAGAARPSYAVLGTLWTSTAIAGSLIWNVYDGAADRTVFSINIATGAVTFAAHLHAIADVNALQAALDAKLAAAAYTALDVLAKLLTVDGLNSGLDADKVRNTTPSTVGLSLLGASDQAAGRSALGLTGASASDVQAGADSIKQVTAAALAGSAAFQALTFGSPTNWNMATGYNAQVTLAGNTTLAVSNPIAGLSYTLVLTQDATGGRTVSWPASFAWGAAGAPTLSGAGKTDVVSLMCLDAGAPKFAATISKGY